ncbi:hypothetical protein EVB87_061 [Rhizobium phage RHph_N28_1]|nr:hypothetical protein EVB87_061 [Rhizobium phage RHph_N28_1]QIG74089.1 hypothetical protein EVC07_061 [Rhizobium phage RHph_N42]
MAQFAVISYYHPHEGHSVINEVVSPFTSISEAFEYITDRFPLHNEHYRACMNYDFQVSTSAEIYTRDRIGHVRIQLVRNPDEDILTKKLARLDRMSDALTLSSTAVVEAGALVRFMAADDFKPEAVHDKLKEAIGHLTSMATVIREELNDLKEGKVSY